MSESESSEKPAMLRFGIDLGTTYSSIGWYNPDRHEVDIAELDSAGGTRLLPSAVFVQGPGEVIVGNTAINAGLEKPERLFRWFKRDLGNPPSPHHIIDGKQWTPVECSTEILKALKREGELFFKTEVKDVVITFPAFFEPDQRDLTREAAVKAGLNVITMIEEPVAAALAYVIDDVLKKGDEASKAGKDLSSVVPVIIERLAGKDKAVLVYDLGGGTFDVALLQAWGTAAKGGPTELHTKVLDHDGDIFLGGKNWDEAFKQLVAELDLKLNSHDPLNDPQATRLDDECEQRKRDLGKRDSVKILCPSLHQIEITQTMLKERTAELLKKTRQIIEEVIEKARNEHGIPKENLTLLLSGGMCKWPLVGEMLTEVMNGHPPLVHKNVDLMVTYGAAYVAYLTVISETELGRKTPKKKGDKTESTSGKEASPPVLESAKGVGITLAPPEVPYPAIGVEVLDEKDIKREATYISKVIPSKAVRGDYYDGTYRTVSDGQTDVAIALFFLKEHEGHTDAETNPEAWQKYKTFVLTVPPLPAGQKVCVRLKYTEGGVIDGKAWTDDSSEIEIKGTTCEKRS